MTIEGLTIPMRDLLWKVAQHKYGWTHASRHRGGLQVADALVRRNLVQWSHAHPREHHQPIIVLTRQGRRVVGRLWPVSPLWLGTYAEQPNGWDPPEGRTA